MKSACRMVFARLPISSSLALIGLALMSCATTEKVVEPRCHQYFLIPPAHADLVISDFVATTWLEAKAEKLENDCHQVHDYKDSKRIMRSFGVDQEDSNLLTEMPDRQKELIAYQTNSSHLLSLDFKVRKGILYIIPKTLSLQSQAKRKLTKKYALRTKLDKNNIFEKTKEQRWIVKSLNLLPNSLIGGFSTSNLQSQIKAERLIKLDFRDRNPILPPIVSSIGFTNAMAPYEANFWDITGRWVSDVSLSYLDRDVVYIKRETPEVTNQDGITLFGAGAVASGELSLHTLLGATFLQMGFGLGAYYVDDSLSRSGLQLRRLFRIGLGHRAYFDDRYFLLFKVTAQTFFPKLVENDVFYIDGQVEGFLGLGIYFPESKESIRRLFK